MADLEKKATAEETRKPVEKVAKTEQIGSGKKIGLVEAMLIMMLVGLVFIFIFPMQQLKVDKAAEEAARLKISPLVDKFELVIEAMEQYRANDPFGEYPFTIEELNLTTINNDEFVFSYDSEAKKVTATSQEAYGKAGIKVNYSLEDKIYEVEDPTPQKKPTIKNEWLI
ncbi:MAG: hypothetical protein V3576_08775 [Candidatus Cloacimonadota bacterium]